MEIKTKEITSLLKQQLDDYKIDIDISEVGEVTMWVMVLPVLVD